MSPFSTRCNYKIEHTPAHRRGELQLSPRDSILIFRVQLSGAAAFFQICERKKDRDKLKKLCQVGILNMYRFEGAYRMNVVSWDELDTYQLLCRLVLCQYLLMSGAVFDGRDVYINGISHRLFVVRYGDMIDVDLMNRSSRALIIAEEYCVQFQSLKVPIKLILDDDLASNVLCYYDAFGAPLEIDDAYCC